LTVHLTQRLIALGIPASYRSLVISAVTTGSISAQEKKFSKGAGAAINHIIHEVVSAAYQAFARGLDLALGISFCLLLGSALIAFYTGTSEGTTYESDQTDPIS
jgi:hypothetical protein